MIPPVIQGVIIVNLVTQVVILLVTLGAINVILAIQVVIPYVIQDVITVKVVTE